MWLGGDDFFRRKFSGQAVKPERPSGALVETYWRTYQNSPAFTAGDGAIAAAFSTFPHNANSAHVRLKVCLLNDIYGTNIYDTARVAAHIQKLRIDQRLAQHDFALVEDIANVEGHKRRVYSFASKYCALHEPNGFSIYDSFVDRVLWHFRQRDQFSDFRRTDLKDYARFMAELENFRNAYGLQNKSRIKLDKFLWLYGKAKFPTKAN